MDLGSNLAGMVPDGDCVGRVWRVVGTVIRCTYEGANHLIRAFPCPIHRGDKRDKKLALAVIRRDKVCWRCGTTENLEAGHIIPKERGGADTMSNMRAECRALNRKGVCK